MKRQKENKLHGFVTNSMKTALSTYRKIENTDTLETSEQRYKDKRSYRGNL